jgi:hypothetical protein
MTLIDQRKAPGEDGESRGLIQRSGLRDIPKEASESQAIRMSRRRRRVVS